MSTKKKILFVNDEMVMGGVARVLNNLLKEMDKDKYEIDLLILHKHGELLKEIPEGVNVLEGTPFFRTVDIPLKQCNLSNIFPWLRQRLLMRFNLIENRIRKERKKILNKQYDVEFAAKEGFCTIFVGCGDTPIKLNWVLTDYKEENFSKNHMGLVKKMLERIDLNIACSDTVNNSYREVFGVDNIKTI
ncbi:MAG: glycosyltransferase, partial [Erysipelotrichaceae bacterium]|nr:glycosyltransferase [Erysipelotrichaceae bacterium]